MIRRTFATLSIVFLFSAFYLEALAGRQFSSESTTPQPNEAEDRRDPIDYGIGTFGVGEDLPRFIDEFARMSRHGRDYGEVDLVSPFMDKRDPRYLPLLLHAVNLSRPMIRARDRLGRSHLFGSLSDHLHDHELVAITSPQGLRQGLENLRASSRYREANLQERSELVLEVRIAYKLQALRKQDSYRGMESWMKRALEDLVIAEEKSRRFQDSLSYRYRLGSVADLDGLTEDERKETLRLLQTAYPKAIHPFDFEMKGNQIDVWLNVPDLLKQIDRERIGNQLVHEDVQDEAEMLYLLEELSLAQSPLDDPRETVIFEKGRDWWIPLAVLAAYADWKHEQATLARQARSVPSMGILQSQIDLRAGQAASTRLAQRAGQMGKWPLFRILMRSFIPKWRWMSSMHVYSSTAEERAMLWNYLKGAGRIGGSGIGLKPKIKNLPLIRAANGVRVVMGLSVVLMLAVDASDAIFALDANLPREEVSRRFAMIAVDAAAAYGTGALVAQLGASVAGAWVLGSGIVLGVGSELLRHTIAPDVYTYGLFRDMFATEGSNLWHLVSDTLIKEKWKDRNLAEEDWEKLIWTRPMFNMFSYFRPTLDPIDVLSMPAEQRRREQRVFSLSVEGFEREAFGVARECGNKEEVCMDNLFRAYGFGANRMILASLQFLGNYSGHQAIALPSTGPSSQFLLDDTNHQFHQRRKVALRLEEEMKGLRERMAEWEETESDTAIAFYEKAFGEGDLNDFLTEDQFDLVLSALEDLIFLAEEGMEYEWEQGKMVRGSEQKNPQARAHVIQVLRQIRSDLEGEALEPAGNLD